MGEAFDHLRAALADHYTLERELGQGGMATVYLARDVRHNRHVAIKVMHAELALRIGAERFLKEIETTANLQHPNILPLFDSGRVEAPASGRLSGPVTVPVMISVVEPTWAIAPGAAPVASRKTNQSCRRRRGTARISGRGHREIRARRARC